MWKRDLKSELTKMNNKIKVLKNIWSTLFNNFYVQGRYRTYDHALILKSSQSHVHFYLVLSQVKIIFYLMYTIIL